MILPLFLLSLSFGMHMFGNSTRSHKYSNHNDNSTALVASVGIVIVAIAYGTLAVAKNSNITTDPTTCAYVPGAGFSGFPFTLGRLQSVQDPTSIDYYCYSAGCLAAVAALSNTSANTACQIASNAVAEWKNGTLNRFDVVDYFVTKLVDGNDEDDDDLSSLLDEERLAKLNIITSVPSWRGGLKTVTRSPTTTAELKEMLVQTTWIPGVTGNGLTHNEHMDGAFTAGAHPSCPTVVSLPELSWESMELFTNTLNMNLKPEQFWRFVATGKQYGLPQAQSGRA